MARLTYKHPQTLEKALRLNGTKLQQGIRIIRVPWFHILSAKSSTKAIIKCDAEIAKMFGVGGIIQFTFKNDPKLEAI